MKEKKLLFIFQSNYNNAEMVGAGFDALITAIVFGQEVSLIFLNSGVSLINKNTKHLGDFSSDIKQKIDAIIELGVPPVYAYDKTDHLTGTTELYLNAKLVNEISLRSLISRTDHCLNF